MNLVIGITGSIGSGKSTVAEMFVERGFAIQDADKVVHDIYEQDKQTISKINTEFLGCVKEGKVDRNKLKQIISNNPENKIKLERIVHPVVAKRRDEFIKKYKKCILDVPLLFEVGVDECCDVIITTYCPDNIRRKRVLKRGYNADIFEILNGSQMLQSDKITHSDIIIDTSKPIIITKQEVNEIIYDLEEDFC